MTPHRSKGFQRIALPAALVTMLGTVLLLRGETDAFAAMQERGDYLVVAGSNGQGDDQVLWILDTRAEELVAAGWDNPTNAMKGFGTRSVNRDLEQVRRRR